MMCYSDLVTIKSETRWLKVDNVTSVTKEEENDRQQKAESDSGRRNDTCTGHEADSPGQPVKRARTDNASLLEASIDQLFSSEKLNGDTVNLYFDFLRNNRAFGGGNWEFGIRYKKNKQCRKLGGNLLVKNTSLLYLLFLLTLLLLLPAG